MPPFTSVINFRPFILRGKPLRTAIDPAQAGQAAREIEM
jgi:hypothetical protein